MLAREMKEGGVDVEKVEKYARKLLKTLEKSIGAKRGTELHPTLASVICVDARGTLLYIRIHRAPVSCFAYTLDDSQ